jgi:cardiolipin synthase
MHNHILEFLILYGFFVVAEILLFLTLCHMLYQRRSPTSLISWLLFMVVLPYFSVLLYFLIGRRKQSDSRSKSSLEIKSSGGESTVEVNSIDGILRSNGITGVSEKNSFELITDSVKAFETMMDEIQKAEKSISMSTYVFKKDAMTELILDALTLKVSQGVEVRVLIDSLGSYAIYFFQSAFRKLRQAGGDVRFFMPLLRLPYRNYINLRNHRKIYLFDECTLLSGGMNLSDEYMGPVKNPGQWEDVLFKTEGEATYQYAQIFENDWAYATGKPIRQAALTSVGVHGDTYIQVIPSGPDIKGDALYKALISAIYTVKERIWIVTPYFVPDESLFLALKIAKLKGVDVKLITPKNSNHLIADLGRSSYMRELAESGIDLVLYNGSMLHAKAILLDSDAAMLGSVNIDNRSLLLNYEVVSFAYSETIINEVDTWMQGFMVNAEYQMPKASKLRRIAENFMRILAPQL